MDGKQSFNISLEFKDITLPPFRDILILAKKCPHGIKGITRCFHLIAQDEFELIEIDNSTIEAFLVNKRILKKVPISVVIDILTKKVFPHVNIGDMVKVDLDVTVKVDDIEISG